MTQLLDRLKSQRKLSIIGAAALGLAIILVLVFVVAGVGGDDDDDGGDAGGDNPGQVVNQAGGYSITLPEGWTSAQQGRLTTVKSPAGDATMEIAPGRPGPLEEAAALLYQQVGRNYETADRTNLPSAIEAKKIAGENALVYAGGGVNRDGLAIRFLTITIQDQPTNWWITIYVPENSNPDQTLPNVTKIVETFRPL